MRHLNIYMPQLKILKSIDVKTCYNAINTHLKAFIKCGRKMFTWSGTIPPSKTNCLTSQSCPWDVLTCRVFNTSRYHEPRPSKHRYSIPQYINHLAINMNHECMNMLYATLLPWLFDLVLLTSLLDSDWGYFELWICAQPRREKGERPGPSPVLRLGNIPH